MTEARWPFPGDSPIAVARKMAIAYRTHLHAANPQLCDQLDAMAAQWGQTWIVPTAVTVAPGSALTARQAADYLGLTMVAVRRLRLAGRLPGRLEGRVWWYDETDLRALVAAPRPRTRRAS